MTWRKSSPYRVLHHALRRVVLYLLGREARDLNSIRRAERKDGYFSVLTVVNGEPKKFLVALSYLRYPPFVKLLEAAEQEFGFDQPGVLIIPCEASEILRILS
ncbi:hypothetical protein RJ639_020960 [Escallonia herrerae]|uniref:Small auxin up regulated protein n=1 Tax=Escallonia herrerae TaxID=1293975 RepID=A0AA88V548_9ASTE|nr:hypothetical protein RJ639_020960 [Escallonia herrerae]